LPPVDLADGEHLEVVFEGVSHPATADVDGEYAGGLLPYTRNVLPLAGGLPRPHASRVLGVTMDDLTLNMGGLDGWETYSGIIREVYLRRLPVAYLEDPWVETVELGPGTARLRWHVVARLGRGAPEGLQVRVAIEEGTGHSLAESVHPLVPGTALQVLDEVMALPDVRRWSPEGPVLYWLRATLERGSEVQDEVTARFGVRVVGVDERHFLLNGEPVFLAGVCRHDMWSGQGYTLSKEQIAADLQESKELGANFVRLVHYPHDPRVLETCDELGLLVTEEPGLWGIRGGDDASAQAERTALGVLQSTAVRDRGHPSLMAWLLGNESGASMAYLKSASELLRRLDPGRLQGFSDLREPRTNRGDASLCRVRNDQWGADFYDYHPYGEAPQLYRPCQRVLRGKPLLLGEWGGFWVQDNGWLLRQIGDAIVETARAAPDSEHQLAGIAFWEWADMRQYGRGAPACTGGVLREGIVSEDRNPKPELYRFFVELFERLGGPMRPEAGLGTTRGRWLGRGPWETLAGARPWGPGLQALELAEGDEPGVRRRAAEGWRAWAAPYGPWGELPAELSSVLGGLRSEGKPMLLWRQLPEVSFRVGREIGEVWFLGMALLSADQARERRLGATIAVVEVTTAGTAVSEELRYGYALNAENIIYHGGRIDPVAHDAMSLGEFVVDPDQEVRRLWLYRWGLPRAMYALSARLRLVRAQEFLLLQGIGAR
jgi:hypothetical protein